MPIDFPLDPKCSTYGYSFDNVCSGITHTISQNWRIMDDGAGTTFFAPVSTIASIGSDQGPDGQTGMTGMTGMTGNTGEVGATGPQGLTFTSTQAIKGMLFLPSSYGGDESEGVTLDASDTTIIGYNDGDSVEIGRAKEIFTASTSATVVSSGVPFIVINMAADNNTIKRDIVASNILPPIVSGFRLTGVSPGRYSSIVLKRYSSTANPTNFGSEFQCLVPNINGQSGVTTLTQSDGDVTVNYATGVTYELGSEVNNTDVFYVSVINVNYSGNVATDVELLVNHQRYYSS